MLVAILPILTTQHEQVSGFMKVKDFRYLLYKRIKIRNDMIGKLDNPVLHSLLEINKQISIVYEGARFYIPDYCPFGAFENKNTISAGIDEYLKLTDNFYIVGEKPEFSKKLVLENELICLQMIAESNTNVEYKEKIIKLNGSYEDSLFNLVDL